MMKLWIEFLLNFVLENERLFVKLFFENVDIRINFEMSSN